MTIQRWWHFITSLMDDTHNFESIKLLIRTPLLSNFHENDPVIAALVFLSFCEALGVSEDSS